MILIKSATMYLHSPSSCLISQLSTIEDFVSLAVKCLSILDEVMQNLRILDGHFGILTPFFRPQRLINMKIYDKQLYANVEDLVE